MEVLSHPGHGSPFVLGRELDFKKLSKTFQRSSKRLLQFWRSSEELKKPVHIPTQNSEYRIVTLTDFLFTPKISVSDNKGTAVKFVIEILSNLFCVL